LGQLYNLSYNPALDGNAEPYSGAWLHTYIPGTTTPKATYTTDAQSVTNANPLEADSAGRFGAMFATEGEVFDLYLTDADGGNGRTFSDVIALGGTSNAFEKDFGANGRIQIYGEAGVVQIETGDPSPDDVGGRGRIGGWDGTQGTDLELDYTTTTLTGDADVSGSATVGDDLIITNPTSAGSVYAKLASGTATAQTAVDIPLDADFNAYVLEIQYLTAPASPNIGLQLAFDSTPTFKSASGDYAGVNQYLGGTAPGTTSNSTRIDLFPSGIVSGAVLYSRFHLMIDSRAAAETIVSGMVSVINMSGGPVTFWPQGATNAKDYGKATYVRILTAASTISFRWSLLGIPGL